MKGSAHPPVIERYTDGMAPLQTAIICLAVGLAVTVGTDLVTPSYARIGVMLLFGAQIWLEQRCGRRLFLMSPVFLLALVGLVAYTLLPNAIYTALQLFPNHQHTSNSFFGDIYRPEVLAYFGGRGEGLILAFCAAGLAVHGILALVAYARTSRSISRTPDPRGSRARTAYGLSGILGLLFLAATQTDLFSDTATNLIRTGVAPVQAFLLVYLLHCALDRSRIRLMPVVLLIFFNLTVMVLAHGGKIPVLIGLAAGLYYIAHTRVSFSALTTAVVAFAVMLVIVMQIIHLVRAPKYYGPSNEIAFTEKIGNVFLRKLLWRQAETGYCLSKVFAAHKDERFEMPNQTFWMEILIPRAVWPEKADFSLGGRYAKVYCGMKYVNSHSASITLLGQPIIHGGAAALLLHGTFLLVFLWCVGAVAVWWPGLPRVTVFALLPWWIDFDQDFALYMGNMVKFGTFMLPFLLLAMDRTRRRPEN